MRIRIPWPWEGLPDPLQGVRGQHLAVPEALTREVPPHAPPAVSCAGETRGARAQIDRLTGDLRQAGHSPDRARARAVRAAIAWDQKHR